MRASANSRSAPAAVRTSPSAAVRQGPVMDQSPIQSANDSTCQRAVRCPRSDLPKAVALEQTRMTITVERDRLPSPCRPESTATVTTTLPGPNSRATWTAAATFRPLDVPTSTPSSRARRRAMSQQAGGLVEWPAPHRTGEPTCGAEVTPSRCLRRGVGHRGLRSSPATPWARARRCGRDCRLGATRQE